MIGIGSCRRGVRNISEKPGLALTQIEAHIVQIRFLQCHVWAESGSSSTSLVVRSTPTSSRGSSPPCQLFSLPVSSAQRRFYGSMIIRLRRENDLLSVSRLVSIPLRIRKRQHFALPNLRHGEWRAIAPARKAQKQSAVMGNGDIGGSASSISARPSGPPAASSVATSIGGEHST